MNKLNKIIFKAVFCILIVSCVIINKDVFIKARASFENEYNVKNFSR